MKEGVVFVKENSFIYKDSAYLYDEISEKNMIFKRLKAVILEEKLYIKREPEQYQKINPLLKLME